MIERDFSGIEAQEWQEIFEQCQADGTKFVDEVFPPSNDSLADRESFEISGTFP